MQLKRRAFRVYLISLFPLCLFCSSCVEVSPYVAAPAAVHEGDFVVHVVKSPEESLNKILTWYTGTPLSQPIVLRYNPTLQQREIRVGDRILIPVELVANEYPYGAGPQQADRKTQNLLMEETSPTTGPTPIGKLETFGDEMEPENEIGERGGYSVTPTPEGSIQEPLPPISPTPEVSDMPPPGLLDDYQGS